MPKIAVLQMTSGIDPEANFNTIARAVLDASLEGAEMLFTPEMSLHLDRDRKRASQHIEDANSSIMAQRLASLAGEVGLYLAVGAPLRTSQDKLANRQWVFGPNGGPPVSYDKIHMFDVELSTGEKWRESSAYAPGEQVVTIDQTPLGRLGLTICYDMRFPALFEELGQRKCDAITVPAAFTKPTGEAHWHVLLRARAIEGQAFVIAAAQVGKHEDGRETYGHSLVVDPWGEVLLDMGGDEPGLAFCDIDLTRIDEVRQQVPSLANRRKIPK
ncbi:carbon-nitrogen hydrolase family protein [Erythrobacter sp. SCSIO 43205]|uniref:carbon-nitrogen hydrolase family protein n=1 Tax=Erythrobacter sp. SCSIO 43205 TaxID=2779361 RepID=UPI001CA7D12C|nr:carbon-nitrogen hydrolase family protein [Erythrobacter sp. SCSIO 43205]UAB77209.1 carbon-nitrogen hydrolase family protein [Erythrobacter sp. SCSIO 43205]